MMDVTITGRGHCTISSIHAVFFSDLKRFYVHSTIPRNKRFGEIIIWIQEATPSGFFHEPAMNHTSLLSYAIFTPWYKQNLLSLTGFGRRFDTATIPQQSLCWLVASAASAAKTS
jgi:hypothetical protein